MRKAPEPGGDFQMTPGILGRKVVRRPFAQELNSEPLDPLLPYKIDPMNGWKAREGGLQLKA
jgi:hypothetical protein